MFKNIPKLILLLFLCSGCARLFGWDIHAPGILSQNFFYQIPKTSPHRMALYFEPETWNYISHARGGRFADPTAFHVGEALIPMMIEGFQTGFEEFVFLEVRPTPEILKQYGIEYLAVSRIKGVENDMTLKGQGILLRTETLVFSPNLEELAHFESTGSSDAEGVFAKKGGPEVNLNAAIENNVISVVQYLQDSIQTGNWK